MIHSLISLYSNPVMDSLLSLYWIGLDWIGRYKREEMRIEAWQNHEKKKAEMENRKAEVKAEQQKRRANEKCNQKIATSRRIAEEKRAVAEAKLNENAIKTSERGDYIRRNGHLPSSFSFKLPSCCCFCC